MACCAGAWAGWGGAGGGRRSPGDLVPGSHAWLTGGRPGDHLEQERGQGAAPKRDREAGQVVKSPPVAITVVNEAGAGQAVAHQEQDQGDGVEGVGHANQCRFQNREETHGPAALGAARQCAMPSRHASNLEFQVWARPSAGRGGCRILSGPLLTLGTEGWGIGGWGRAGPAAPPRSNASDSRAQAPDAACGRAEPRGAARAPLLHHASALFVSFCQSFKSTDLSISAFRSWSGCASGRRPGAAATTAATAGAATPEAPSQRAWATVSPATAASACPAGGTSRPGWPVGRRRGCERRRGRRRGRRCGDSSAPGSLSGKGTTNRLAGRRPQGSPRVKCKRALGNWKGRERVAARGAAL